MNTILGYDNTDGFHSEPDPHKLAQTLVDRLRVAEQHAASLTLENERLKAQLQSLKFGPAMSEADINEMAEERNTLRSQLHAALEALKAALPIVKTRVAQLTVGTYTCADDVLEQIDAVLNPVQGAEPSNHSAEGQGNSGRPNRECKSPDRSHIEADLYETEKRLGNAERILRQHGYERCTAAACNCSSYHRDSSVERTPSEEMKLETTAEPILHFNVEQVNRRVSEGVDEFIRYHHHPIVTQKNNELTKANREIERLAGALARIKNYNVYNANDWPENTRQLQVIASEALADKK